MEKEKSRKDIVFGSRAIIEAIDTGKEIDKVLVKRGQSNELTDELIDLLKQQQIPFQLVPIEKLNNISQKNHQGCIAFISPVVYQDFEEIIINCFEQGKEPFILLLDEISDVRNFGAISRTAECFGVDAIVIPMKGAAQINADAVKTSAGALLKIPVCRVQSLTNTVDYLQKSGVRIFGITEKAEKTTSDVAYSGPIGLILGSEEHGISNACLRKVDELVKIPMLGTIKSLNVSVSAGIVMHEVVKCRM